MNYYLGRLCWNTDHWSRPTGVAPHAEGTAKGSTPTFVSEYGYGHEEWLFQPDHTIGERRYGFLQPSLNAKQVLHGKSLNVVLYTIDPDNRRWYVGRVDRLEVLSEDEATDAVTVFRQRGWLRFMEDDLAALGRTARHWQAPMSQREIINVRYTPSQVHMLPEPILAPDGDVTRQRGKNRYRFYSLSEFPKPLVGTFADPKRPVGPYSYQTPPAVDADRRHNRLQVKLAGMLRAKYGNDAVGVEVDGVDIVLKRTNRDLYIEVKSEPDARLAIREALGQLLEYAHFPRPSPANSPELVVAAPGQSDCAVEEYVSRLHTRFQLPIRYVAFNEDTADCPL